MMGEGMADVALPFLESGWPVQDVCIYFVPDMINICDNFSTFIHLHRMCPPTDILFWTTDLIIQNGPPLYQIFTLSLGYSAGEIQALQLVLLLAFWAVDEPLIICMTVHFRAFVFQKQLVCNFRIVEGILYIMYMYFVAKCVFVLPKFVC